MAALAAQESDGHEVTRRRKAKPQKPNAWCPGWRAAWCPGCNEGRHAHCLWRVDQWISCECSCNGGPF